MGIPNPNYEFVATQEASIEEYRDIEYVVVECMVKSDNRNPFPMMDDVDIVLFGYVEHDGIEDFHMLAIEPLIEPDEPSTRIGRIKQLLGRWDEDTHTYEECYEKVTDRFERTIDFLLDGDAGSLNETRVYRRAYHELLGLDFDELVTWPEGVESPEL